MTKRPGINERIGSLSSIREAGSDSDKAGRMADQYRRVAGRNAATGDDARAARYSQRADALDKIAKGNPKPIVDQAKLIEKRNETARSLAEQTKATGVDAGRGAAARDLVARNDRDLAALGKPKVGKARAPTPAMHAKSEARREFKEVFGKEAPKSLTTGQMRSRMDMQRHRAREAVTSINAPASRSLDIEGRVRAGVDQRLASSGAPPYGLRIDSHAEAAGAAMTQAIADGKSVAEITAAGQKARAASESAARQAPAAPSRLERGLASITGHPVSRQSPPSVTNDAHMGTTSHAASPPASPPSAPKEPMLSRLGNAYGKAQTGLTVVAAGAQGAHAYSDAREHGASVGAAAFEGMKAAAPSAAIAGAQPLARGLHAVGDGLLAVAESAGKQAGLFDMIVLDMAFAKTAGVTGVAGVAAKGAGYALQAAGKVALPAAAAIGAYQGAKEDSNTARGIGRGVVRSLDPTGIVTGLTGHGAGLAERIYDAAFGKAQQRFKQAAAPAKDSQVADGKRGWANPKVQAAAQAARGRTYSGQE